MRTVCVCSFFFSGVAALIYPMYEPFLFAHMLLVRLGAVTQNFQL